MLAGVADDLRGGVESHRLRIQQGSCERRRKMTLDPRRDVDEMREARRMTLGKPYSPKPLICEKQRVAIPDQGLRRVRFSREPRGELRASRLRLVVDQVSLSGGVRSCAVEFAADGILRACANRPRCPRAWRRGARRGCEFFRMGFDVGRRAKEGVSRESVRRSGWGCVRSMNSRKQRQKRSAQSKISRPARA